MFGLTRFAENPARSPFAFKCQQRVYESMISTLYKFPWGAPTTYTVGARDMLFNAVIQQIRVLARKVGRPAGNTPSPMRSNQSRNYKISENLEREVGLSQRLMMDLLFAALNAFGFSQLQKHAIREAAGEYGQGISLPTLAGHWPFQTLNPIPEISDDITKFYLQLFDSGYDHISSLGETEATTFEDYCQINRNAVGFPVVEWTLAGIELNFEDAMKIETALMTMYIERGRAQWCLERDVESMPLQIHTLYDLIGMPHLNNDETGARLSGAKYNLTALSSSYIHSHGAPLDHDFQGFQHALLNDINTTVVNLPGAQSLGTDPSAQLLNPTSTSFHPSESYATFSMDTVQYPQPHAANLDAPGGIPKFTFPNQNRDSIDTAGVQSQYGSEHQSELDAPVEPFSISRRYESRQEEFENAVGNPHSLRNGDNISHDPFTDQDDNISFLNSPSGPPGLNDVRGKLQRSQSNLPTHISPLHRNELNDNVANQNYKFYDRGNTSRIPHSVHVHSRSLSGSLQSSSIREYSFQNTGTRANVEKADNSFDLRYGYSPESTMAMGFNEQQSNFGAIGTGLSLSTADAHSGKRTHSVTRSSRTINIDDTIHEEDDKTHSSTVTASVSETDCKASHGHIRRTSSLGQPGPAFVELQIPREPAALRRNQTYFQSGMSTDYQHDNHNITSVNRTAGPCRTPPPAAPTLAPARLSAQSLWDQVNNLGSHPSHTSGTTVSSTDHVATRNRKRSAAIPIRPPPDNFSSLTTNTVVLAAATTARSVTEPSNQTEDGTPSKENTKDGNLSDGEVKKEG